MSKSIKIYKTELKKISFGISEELDRKSQKEKSNRIMVAIGKYKDGSGKVEITFQTKNRGKFKVLSAILAAGEDYIMLKGGQNIPIKSITKISL
jgi:hypothetical protein